MGRAEHGYKLSKLKDALAVAQRKRGAGKSRKLPITPELLRAMFNRLSQQGDCNWLAARDACFYLLAWFVMLRAGEALALSWGDITVSPEGLQLYVAFSKTDQRGDGAVTLLGKLPGSDIDPVAAYNTWRAAAGTSTGPVFSAKGGGRAVVKDTMRSRLQRLLQYMGLSQDQAKLYGLHSLRRGSATAAVRSGSSLRMVMEHGRWTSDCVREYVYADETERWGMTAVMAGYN